MLEIRTLGQYSVQLDDAAIEIRSRPAKTLLAYLVLAIGTHHPRERLAGLFWPDSSEGNARKNLRQTLWRLRKSIGEEYLLVDTESVAFDPSPGIWLDTAVIENAAEEDLETALSEYQGEFLPGYYEDWVILERDRLAAVFEGKMQRFITQLLDQQRWTDTRDWAEQWIAKGQTPEAAFRALMVSYAATGELSKVESIYKRVVEALKRDIGVDPSQETQELYARLISGESAVKVLPEASTGKPMARELNLPAQTTPFIGREEEVAETRKLLTESRLLSLIGPGGIGKTRLAIQLARNTSGQFSDGVYFVNLAAIDAAANIPQLIADSLEFPLSTHAQPDQQLLRYLRNKQLLLVMDNFEHLLGGATLISKVLQAAPQVKVLATSHVKLELHGEAVFPVEGMNFPKSQPLSDRQDQDAVELFVQSAQRPIPGFAPAADDMDHIAEICRVVQGMPLAIELAAAWLDTLSLEEIEDELKRSFDILTTEIRDVPDRQRSIRAAFDHSWSLINKKERDVFLRASVFRGGFTRDAAHRVAGASLEMLATLVGKSLVRHDPNSGRFEVHELMRQYAQEKLELNSDANESAHEAHAAYYAHFMDERWEHLRDERQIAALNEIDVDIENLRTAWRYSINQSDVESIQQFFHGIRLAYTVRGWNYAGEQLFAEAARSLAGSQQGEEAEALAAMAMAYQGFFMAWLGLADQGIELTRRGAETLRRLDRPVELALALNGVTLCAQYLNLQVEQEQAAREMLQIAGNVGDPWLEAFSLFPLSTSRVQQQDYDGAREFAERSLQISEEVGDSIIALYDLLVLGSVAFHFKDFEDAKANYLRSMSLSEKLGHRWAIENASKYLGNVALATNEIEKAEDYFHESLEIAEEIGLGRDLVNLIYEFARVRIVQDRKERAVELLALVLEHPASQQARFGEGLIQDAAQFLLDDLTDDVPEAAYAAAVERGRDLELDQAVADLRGISRTAA